MKNPKLTFSILKQVSGWEDLPEVYQIPGWSRDLKSILMDDRVDSHFKIRLALTSVEGFDPLPYAAKVFSAECIRHMLSKQPDNTEYKYMETVIKYLEKYCKNFLQKGASYNESHLSIIIGFFVAISMDLQLIRPDDERSRFLLQAITLFQTTQGDWEQIAELHRAFFKESKYSSAITHELVCIYDLYGV